MELSDVQARLIIKFSVSSYISYANYRNQKAVKPIYFEIQNISKSTIDDLSFSISSSNGLIEPYMSDPFSIEPENMITPKTLAFKFDERYLLSLTESENCVINFKVYYQGNVLFEQEEETEIVTFDYWRSTVLAITEDDDIVPVMPTEYKALLTSFITPNHPIVRQIAVSSTKWLGKWTGDPSLDGYQSKDPERVKHMVASVYAAIQQKNIIYAEPPKSFGMGQRIRMCYDIEEQHVGTCMDLTLLFASVLESIGLRPILILHEGHIYCGCWLVEDSFKAGVIEDFTQVTKRIIKGIEEIVIFECTAVCAGRNIDFNEACKVASNTIQRPDFEAVVDVHALRVGWEGYRPLPLLIKEGSSLRIDHSERQDEEITGKAQGLDKIELGELKKAEVNKVTYWERKLLDLSTRNTLINTRFKQVVPIITSSVSEIEDKLFEGSEYSIQSFKIEDADEVTVEFLENVAKNADFIKEASKQKAMFTYGTEKPVATALNKIYRNAKNSLEESGSNTLYLATGFLRWFEGKSVRYSPLILIPIDLNRSAAKGFTIRKRDEDTEFNVTLLEMLKQDFGMEINGLDPLPEDQHGIDIQKVNLIIRKATINKPGWEIVELCAIGNFSFTQFVMYNDIHRSIDKLARNKVVSSLIEGAVNYDTTIPKDVDEGDVYLPISVDESQLHAIKMAEKGCTFVLHGPPGTGKSQTITAMIANAIANGKTVLFVAEKMAALEVVDNRLSSLGLEPFCLELHSNKASKKNVLEQLDAGLNLKYKGIKSDYYNYTLEDLQKLRSELDEYSKELHRKQNCGYSLRELMDLYDDLEGEEIRSNYNDIRELTYQDLARRRKLIDSLLASGKEIKGYDQNLLSHFNIDDYTLSLQYEIEGLFEDYKDAVREVKAKDISFAYKPEVAEDKETVFVRNMESGWSRELLDSDISSYENRIAEANRKVLFKAKGLEAIKEELRSYHLTQDSFDPAQAVQDIRKYQTTKAEIEARPKPVIEDDNLIAVERVRNIEDKLKNDGVIIPVTDDTSFEANLKLVDTLNRNLSQIRDYNAYKQTKDECLREKLDKVVEAYDRGTDDNLIVNSYTKGLYKALIMGIISESPALNRFTGASFNEKIRQFKELDKEFCDVTREEIYYILAHQLPAKYESFEVNKELAVLKKAIASKGKGYSIRNLFAEIPNILTRITPCVMMSPISVAQYLSPDMPPFDIVVFDEASQLPTCKAVGVLARGNSAVIVGDPKQMPPTSFFAGNYVDEENINFEDLDSILDDCLALGLPETHLQWHYRSRHESLIAFSNREFYSNKMLTFPSVNDQERRVRYVKVKGFYDQKKGTNEAEARSIIAEIRRRYNDPRLRDKSIGVITFNIKQQNYIEDLLLEECKKDNDFDSWVNREDNKLFVKNLENVQGDERDVILFSILFGPNQNKKLSLNFGPINKEGGWKRLNVAASRAKQEMILFSIMSYDMIDLSRTSSVGVSALRDFLEYGERGTLISAYDERNSHSSGLANRIIRALEEKGYRCIKNVGNSEFKIDIAVTDPRNSQSYILGILLDGDVYSKTQNTRDREVAQISVLSSLGWNIHRIWAMDYWADERKEISKVLDLLEELKKKTSSAAAPEDDQIAHVDLVFEYEDEESKKKTKRKSKTVKIAQKEVKLEGDETVLTASKVVSDKAKTRYIQINYKYADLPKKVINPVDLFEDEVQSLIIDRMNEIIAVEAPITVDSLCRKLLISIGIDNENNLVQAALTNAMNSLNGKVVEENGVYWIWNQEPDKYYVYRFAEKRDLNDICEREFLNAICLALQDKGTMGFEDLMMQTAINLGHTSISEELVTRANKAIPKAITQKEILLLEEGKYTLG